MLLVNGATPEPVDVRVRGARVVEVAPRLERERGEPVADLGGRLIRRAFRDAHVHFAAWARSRRRLDLSGAGSAEQAADVVARAVVAQPPGVTGVLEGGGFRDSLWPTEPTTDLLTAAAPGRAVVLQSLDMHTAWLSQPALALCGLPDHPSGLLREHEAWDALARLPAPSEAEDDEAATEAVAAAQARGVTRIVDFDFGDAHGVWHRRQREQEGRLGLRVTAVVQQARMVESAEAGLVTGLGDEWLRVGAVKLFADGSLGSRTARCLHPYPGGDDRGRQLLDPHRLREVLAQAQRLGFAAAVHAIGDEATRDVLAALADARMAASVEHAQLLRPQDLPLFRAARVTASLQPAHLLDDVELVESLWAGTRSLPYAFRSLLDAGASVVLGSDAPVAPLDPWLGLAAAVHRTDGSRPPWRAEEAVTLEEALAASGARRPRAGDDADLVVLDLAAWPRTPHELTRVPVYGVLLAGEWVVGPGARSATGRTAGGTMGR